MPSPNRNAIPVVVQQYAESAAQLRVNRAILVRAPHVGLTHLRRLDDRLAAQLDGLAVAGAAGWAQCQASLDAPDCGPVFTATVCAIKNRDIGALDKLIALSEAVPPARAGLFSALGWVEAAELRGIIKPLLDAPHSFRRQVGLVACSMHRVDAGPALAAALTHADAELKIRALYATANGGRLDQLTACHAAALDDNPDCRFHAARAALLLGEREAPLMPLQSFAAKPGPHQSEALALILKVLTPAQTHALLQPMSTDAASVRTLIRAIGMAGDPRYVPWLIRQMDDVRLTRLAGESFSLLTGVDLSASDMELQLPETANAGPSDDPDDNLVALDEDESLPWPDAEKVAVWWRTHEARYAPGTRYFMGEPPSPAHCLSVLKTGFQRQRTSAAEYLCLLRPGTPLFNTAEPAWRQQKLLTELGA